MNAIGVLTLLGLLGLGFCQTAVPTFTWLDAEISPTGVPLLSVNFNDGGADDVAVLKQINPIRRRPDEREEDIDRCIFDGYLRDESKVYVTLTGGCPFEDSFEIQFRSSRTSATMFKVVGGQVRVVPSIFSRNLIEDVALPVPVAGSVKPAATVAPPNGFNLKVKMHYDQTFKSQFGSDSVNAMRRVVAQVQNVYYWPTLPTTVTINVIDEMEIPYSINADQPSMDLVGSTYANDGNINSFLFISNRNDASPAAGLGYVNAVCGALQYRIAISEYYYEDMTSAELMAHELGHNLGMNHDFLSSPTDNRYDSQGRLCTGIQGVMDYSTRDKWTTCSYEDFNASDHSCVAQN